MAFKKLVYLLLFIVLATAAYADSYYNDTTWTNLTNGFDGNTATYAYVNSPGAVFDWKIGKTFTNPIYLTDSYIYAIANGYDTSPYVLTLKLYTYTGSAWVEVATLNSSNPTNEGSVTYNGNYAVNRCSYGLAVGYATTNDQDAVRTEYLYELQYNQSVSETYKQCGTASYPLNDSVYNVTNSIGNIANASLNGTGYGKSFYPGTISGATYVDGKYGNGLRFNGNDYVVANSTLGGSFTLSVWLNLAPTYTGTRILGKQISYSGDEAIYFAMYRSASGTITLDIRNDTSTNRFATSGWTPGVLQHFVATFDDTTKIASIYRNGVWLQNKTYTTGPSVQTANLYLGNDHTLGSSGFNGTIDSVLIFDTALNSTQVADLYLNRYPASNRNLTAAYYMDDSAATLTDSNHLTAGPTGNAGTGFDSVDDYINTSNMLENASSFTISTWINPSGLGTYRTIFQKNISANKIRGIIWNNNVYRFYLGSAFASCTISTNEHNTWNQLVSLFNGTHIQVYKNGALCGTPTAASQIYDTSILSISSSLYLFNGSIADVRVFDRALDSYLINYMYLEGAGQNPGVLTISASNQGTPLTGFTYTINGVTYASGSSISLSAGTYSVSVAKSGYNFVQPTLITVAANANNVYTFETYALNNCTLGSPTINFSFYNENSAASSIAANGSIQIAYENGNNGEQNYYADFTNSNYLTICSNPNDATYAADVYMTYSNGFTHRYYLPTASLNSSVQQISLYNWITTTGASELRLTVKDSNSYNALPNIIVKLQRLYPGEGVWRTVQMDKTGDFGKAYFNIIEKTVDYRFIFTDDEDNVLYTSNSLKFGCSSGICEVTWPLIISTASDGDPTLNVTDTYANNLINVSFSDATGDTASVRVIVTKETMSSTRTLCNSTVSAASGITSCNVTGQTGTAKLTVISTVNGVQYNQYSKFIKLASAIDLGAAMGEDAPVWAFLIVAAVVLLGIVSPVAVIIGTVIGLIFISFMGLVSAVTITFVVIAAVLGIAIALKVKQ